MNINYKPDNYPTVSSYFIVKDVGKFMNFMVRAFDGEKIEQITDKGGKITHGEIRIEDSVIMAGRETPDSPSFKSMVYIYTKDVDAIYQQALKAGAMPIMEPADQFYGDRSGGVEGPDGNYYWLATHFEDVSVEEMIRRSSTREE